MKKILVIIILSLLWSGNSYSMQFINCYDASNIAFDPMKLPKELRSFSLDPTKDKKINNSVKTIDDFKKEAFLNYSEKYKKKNFDGKFYESFEFRLLVKSKVMQLTQVISDEIMTKQPTLVKDFNLKKIHKSNIPIILATKDYIEAGGGSGLEYQRFNLNNGTVLVSHDKNFRTKLSLLHCQILKKKSNYLDYWWAVILIIAITFFIFTQSGKRLKQIRRK